MSGDRLINNIVEMLLNEKIPLTDNNIVIRLRELSQIELERLLRK